MNNLYIINHPLIQSKITMLRLKETETGSKAFRELVSEIAALICYEATKNLEVSKIEIDSIFGKTEGKILEKKVSIVPILRAGIGMVDGILSLIPNANVGHIGLYREPETLKPVEYFCKLPVNVENSEILLIDPMLATGGTAIMAIDALKSKGCQNIKFLCLISCPEGVKALHSSHPDVDIYTASLDEKLNEHGYIIPGLGDAGDRMFGTK